MDMISFDSACRCLARVLERETPRAPSSSRSPYEGVESLTQDQKNLDLMSRVRVVKRG